jgi:hypothetical protein
VSKQTRTVFTMSLTYAADVASRCVTHDGREVSREESNKVLKILDSRMRSAKARRLHDATLRSLGMIKVRGAISGQTYWE